jgi:hypothetical protein
VGTAVVVALGIRGRRPRLQHSIQHSVGSVCNRTSIQNTPLPNAVCVNQEVR